MTSPTPLVQGVASAQSTSSLSFSHGFILGQISVVILLGAFIKFFIFGDAPAADVTETARVSARRRRNLSQKQSRASNAQHRDLNRKRSGILKSPPPLTTETILNKTYYNVKSHQPESLDWFNVLVAQTIAQFRNDAQHDDAILSSLDSLLNGSQKPDFLDEIRVTEFSLGEDFPIFSNCRIIPVEEDSEGQSRGDGGRLQARMDVDLSDFITLGVETKLLLNYPKPFTAVLPIALAVSVVRFSGTLSISFVPSSPPGPSPTTLAFSFLDDYRLDLSVRSLVGSRSRLQDVPKIAQLLEARLHNWFDERCVEPRFQQIILPSLWPRKQNTRGGEEDQPSAPIPERNLEHEARVELEAERAGMPASGSSVTGDESLRRRGWMQDGHYTMPGSMPGMMVN
ncbi:MAG: ERMES complex subunit mmm1 [Sarcosagium campestre]|nr:MAG: ERMES complex subunit mmm1 [Sarcosagium campestre]